MRGKARKPWGKQRGTLIVALMAGIAIMMILSTVAVQNWADVVRRDNEAEMMFRAQDIVRALKRFQADKGKLPNDLKELMEPGQKGQYFLRKLWKDPLVKGGQWQFVYAAPGGGIFDPTVPNNPAPQGTGLQGIGLQGAQPGASLAGNDSAAFPPIGGRLGQDGAGAGEAAGLPIAGVKTRCKERPFRRYKEKDDYGEWVFSIFELEQRQPNPAAGQQNPQATFPPPPQTPPQQPPPGQSPVEVK